MKISHPLDSNTKRLGDGTKRRFIIPSVVTVAIIIVYIPVLVWLFQSWLNNPYYGHGFLIPLVSGTIIWLRRASFRFGKPSLLGIIVLGVGLLIYVLSFVWNYYFISAISLLVVIFGTIIYLCGKERAEVFLFSILFLIFMIPLPFVDTLSYYLQGMATYSSAGVVHLFGIDVITVGNQIDLPGASFTIGTACSGMSSLISLLTIAAILIFLVNGSPLKKSIILLSALPISILANTFRIAILLLVAYNLGTEVAMNYFHVISSPFVYLLSIVLLIVLTKILGCRIRTLTELSNG
ncbi:exosortase/archaeosortase family protein [Chloroflexota bacterium]